RKGIRCTYNMATEEGDQSLIRIRIVEDRILVLKRSAGGRTHYSSPDNIAGCSDCTNLSNPLNKRGFHRRERVYAFPQEGAGRMRALNYPRINPSANPGILPPRCLEPISRQLHRGSNPVARAL